MTTRNLHQRLHAVMQAVSYIQKEKKAGMRYSIVSHDAVTAKVRPSLIEQGIVYYPVALEYQQDGNRTQVSLSVRFVNIDDPSDFIDVPSLGFGIDDQDKGAGKAISYSVKYAILKTLGLESGDDPDQDQDVQHRPGTAPARSTSAPAAPQPDEQARKRAETIRDKIDAAADVAEVNRVMLAYATDLDSLPQKSRAWLEDRAAKRRGTLAQAQGAAA